MGRFVSKSFCICHYWRWKYLVLDLCPAGICNQSSNPARTTQTTSAQSTTTQPQSTTNVDTTVSTVKKLSNTITAANSKPLTLTYQFISSKIVDPDRFRFIEFRVGRLPVLTGR